jgi:hypothetical protein
MVEQLAWGLGGLALGVILVLVDNARDRAKLRRQYWAAKPGPGSTAPPTVAELRQPDWMAPPSPSGDADAVPRAAQGSCS